MACFTVLRCLVSVQEFTELYSFILLYKVLTIKQVAPVIIFHEIQI